VWAGLSIVAATAVAVMLAARRARSPLLVHFAVQMAVWGGLIGISGALRFSMATLHDVAGATRLERLVWMNIGLDAGYVAAGAVLSLTAWLLARKMAAVGAGIAIIVQGLALLLINLQFAAVVSK
jgi:hypothetical protein